MIRWFEVIECDMRMAGVCEEDVEDRSKMKLRTRLTDPQIVEKEGKGK